MRNNSQSERRYLSRAIIWDKMHPVLTRKGRTCSRVKPMRFCLVATPLRESPLENVISPISIAGLWVDGFCGTIDRRFFADFLAV